MTLNCGFNIILTGRATVERGGCGQENREQCYMFVNYTWPHGCDEYHSLTAEHFFIGADECCECIKFVGRSLKTYTVQRWPRPAKCSNDEYQTLL
jgi:hypothetical protein